jgi:SAM-dependent methyltransferase
MFRHPCPLVRAQWAGGYPECEAALLYQEGERPVVGDGRHWFEDVADHLGSAYLRYSFTKGTDQEVDFLVDALGLAPGARVLDVGCGPGRHAHALGRRGFEVVGVDISERFVVLARDGAPSGAAVTFERCDARTLRFEREFDAVISLCQGAFGLSAGPGGESGALDPDRAVLDGMARALKPGGRLALSAFSAYFQVRFLGEADSFDAERGVNHEHTAVRNEDGVEVPADLWTTCFTPRELRLMAEDAGLRPEHVWSVTPGDYAARPPDIDHPEFLLVATRVS